MRMSGKDNVLGAQIAFLVKRYGAPENNESLLEGKLS